VTPEQIALVERTLAEIEPELDAIVADFYRRLFAADPSVRPLFDANLAAQRTKFVAELEHILRSIRDHDAFRTRAALLGAEHERDGVRPRHYHTAGIALLDALAAALGERWADDVAQAWAAAYDLTTAAMLCGSEVMPVELSVSRRRPG
jgi:hemoglobin-like flavoprotein